MDKAILFYIVIVVLYGVAGMLVLFNATSMHENAHVQIFKGFGNCDTRIDYVWLNEGSLVKGITTATNCSYISPEYIEDMRILNAQNEIAGYNSQGVILMGFVAGFFVVMLLGMLVCLKLMDV